MSKNYKYIDLFAGCGGLSLGLHNSGWKGLFAIEKSPDAFCTLKHNLIDSKKHFMWPKWLPQTNHEINYVLENYKEQLDSLKGKVDLVAGGPPCQGFSTAGRRKENDQRNNLVEKYIEFIKIVQPKIIFFENVKGFTLEFKKNKDKGTKYVNYVTNALEEANYHVSGEIINFGDYGVPQRRNRFILVGVRKDIKNSSLELAKSFFNEIVDNKIDFLQNKGIDEHTNLEQAISDLLRNQGEIPSIEFKKFKLGVYGQIQSDYQRMMRAGVKNDIPDSHRFANHTDQIVDRFQHIIENNTTKNKDIDPLIRDKYKINKHTIIPLDKNTKSPTITTLPDDYIHYGEPRILTVREYARIQSFPDWYEIKGKYTTGGIERTKEVPRYTQIGNAIPPLFSEQCGMVLKKLIK